MAIPRNSLQNISGISLFCSSFANMEDPRRENKGNFSYPLHEILFLVISSVLSGSDSFLSIEQFGKVKLPWLRKFYAYESGIPSHDILGDLFARLNPEKFSECFIQWINSLSSISNGEVIAIDGKTLRGSANSKAKKKAFHIVSAYAAQNRLCLGQTSVDEKSNEITAIPKLLDLINVDGCIVTIDAMGCQKKIAETIIEKKADYVLMVKDNQKELKEQIEKTFNVTAISSTDTSVDAGHGRVETRKCDIITDLDLVFGAEDWVGINAIARITSERFIKKSGLSQSETRYYITSLNQEAENVNQIIRSHWAIENNLHWSLDVLFREDQQLKKKDNTALNFNVINKIALTMIDQERSTKASKPIKRQKAALSDEYREFLLKV
jgi:predicted transposase YbfD/YdcC